MGIDFYMLSYMTIFPFLLDILYDAVCITLISVMIYFF